MVERIERESQFQPALQHRERRAQWFGKPDRIAHEGEQVHLHGVASVRGAMQLAAALPAHLEQSCLHQLAQVSMRGPRAAIGEPHARLARIDAQLARAQVLEPARLLQAPEQRGERELQQAPAPGMLRHVDA